MKLPIMFFMVVAIPVIIGLMNEAAGDIMLDTVLPSAFSMLIVAHYFLWLISPLLVIVPYAVIIALILTRGYIYDQASYRVQQMRARLNTRREMKKVAGWHERSGLAFNPDESFLQSMRRYWGDLPVRYKTWWLDAAATITYYLCRWTEIPGAMHRLLFTSPAKDSLVLQWRNMNVPAHLHGCVPHAKDLIKAEQAVSSDSTPPLPPQIQGMTKNVRARWDLESDDNAPTQCSDAAKGYVLRLLGMGDLQLAYPAQASEAEKTAEVGAVLSLGWQTYSRAPINSELANAFKSKFGYCSTTKRALGRVIVAYREQMLAGTSLKFFC
jgi:hypothetical protein